MTSWRSLGHRGDATEDIINATNKYYDLHGVAVINKMPVPIKVIEIEDSLIKKAFFEEKSTVDYYGVVQGIPIVFDAKETEKKSLPLQNIHAHQIEYMKKIRRQNGLAFIIVYFKYYNEFILIPLEIIDFYYQNSLNGGRKSIPYSELDKNFTIEFKNGVLHYLDTLNVYLKYIENNKFIDYGL